MLCVIMSLIKPINLSKILVYNNFLNLYIVHYNGSVYAAISAQLRRRFALSYEGMESLAQNFENYVEVLDASRADGQPTDRLKALVNCVSYQVYEYIEEATAYDTPIATLRGLLSKAPNEVFARHLLATAKQEPGHTLDEFLLSLQ